MNDPHTRYILEQLLAKGWKPRRIGPETWEYTDGEGKVGILQCGNNWVEALELRRQELKA